MIEVKKISVPLKRKNKLINLLAIFIMLASLFLITAKPTYGKQLSVCNSASGAMCWCAGKCVANLTRCWCE